MIQEEISKTKEMAILIVDDDIYEISLIKDILSEEGYENVFTASSRSEALIRIDEIKPDFLLFDINMPDMDGFEVCKTLHRGKKTSDIPVIMIAAKISQENLKKGFEVGVFDYIKKPFDEVELIARVQSALKLKQSRDELKKSRNDFQQVISNHKKIEEALKESEEKFREIFENANDEVLYLDRHCKILDVNTKSEDIFLFKPEELIGKNLFRLGLLGDEALNEIVKVYKDLFGEGKSSRFMEIEVSDKKGNKIPVEVGVNAIKRDGKITGALCTIRDITDRKKIMEELRESEERYSTIVEESNDAIIILKNLKIVFANKKAVEISGYSLDYVGKHILGFVSINLGQLKALLENYCRRMSGEGDSHSIIEANIRRKDGRIVPAEVSIAKIEYEGGPAEVLFIRDITERRESEAKLKELLEELERSNKELEQFAYVASHDLQEPLRMVSSYLQLISRRYKGKLDSDADEFIHYAVDGATRMQAMIQSLLTYSRVGTSGKHFEPVDCEVVLDQALNNLSVIIEEKNVLVTHDPIPTVMADDIQLVQLLQNLIGNGIKYNDKDSLQIHVSCEQKEGEWVFSVADNGIGIDTKYKDEIFQIFGRLHGKEYSGTGIGLAVCKKIVERHGGRIWMESEPGKGSTFYFTIPFGGGEKNE